MLSLSPHAKAFVPSSSQPAHCVWEDDEGLVSAQELDELEDVHEWQALQVFFLELEEEQEALLQQWSTQ
ncbi:hypothetical protein WJX81_003156 [Elliptochloris bilobata]|uniref:Uncharacterized protein n=1 Tax=Elliptochloris bilobata TaxID=381761 RepID=A0AAW1RKQ2_9CHLO